MCALIARAQARFTIQSNLIVIKTFAFSQLTVKTIC